MHEGKMFTSQERKGRRGEQPCCFSQKKKKQKEKTHHKTTPLGKASEKVTTQGLVHLTA